MLKSAIKRSPTRKDLLSKVASLIKQADLGGDHQTQFEQSFAQLAYTYVVDRSPRLVPYLVGFQVVDRDNEGTRAVGVFGFRVNDSWVYAPMFFMNGEIKGNELLYLKDFDLFAPMDDGWVNYILSRKAAPQLGHSVPSNPRQLGVRQPDIRTMAMPPFNKTSAVKVFPNVAGGGWLPPSDGFKEFYCAATDGDFDQSGRTVLAKRAGSRAGDVLARLLREDPKYCKLAMDTLEAYPGVNRLFHQFHGSNAIRDALLDLRQKAAAAIEKPASALVTGGPLLAKAVKESKLSVITHKTASHAKLTDEESAELSRRGYLILDKRAEEEVSKAYRGALRSTLTNPAETGLFEVLHAPVSFSRCLVIHSPHSTTARHHFTTVVKLEGDKAWLNVHPTALFARQNEDGRMTFNKWYEALDKGSLGKNGVYVLISRNGEGTVPFKITRELGEGRYEISCHDYSDRGRSPVSPSSSSSSCGYSDHSSSNYDSDMRGRPDLLYMDVRQGPTFHSSQGTLYAPKDCKVFKLKEPPKPKKDSDGDDYEPYVSTSFSSSDDNYFEPGNLADIQMEILQKTAEMTIRNRGSVYAINEEPWLPKSACRVALVMGHGFNCETADTLLDKAAAEAGKLNKYSIRVAYADNFPRAKQADDSLQWGGPYAPPMDEQNFSYSPEFGDVPVNEPDVRTHPVQDLSSSYTDPLTYSPMPEDMQTDPQMMQSAQQAGQMGQKEVFDTAVLSSLLKSVRQDSLLNKYQQDLLTAMDRLGRILFLFYWHNDEFVDRYGKSDTPELEDSIRNSFESIGELVLFLKEKDVEPLLGSGRGQLNVDDSAH